MAISFGARQLPISWMTWKKPLGLLNLGYTSTEIAHMLTLPKPLAKNWYTRQYDSDGAESIRAQRREKTVFLAAGGTAGIDGAAVNR